VAMAPILWKRVIEASEKDRSSRLTFTASSETFEIE
jgi:hypothetical protein